MDLSDINQKIKHIRMANGEYELNEKNVKKDPFEQFIDWLYDALKSETNSPCVMVLATIDEDNLPDTRVVLLKELETNQFIFYSNYFSKKAKQLTKNNVAALNFYWPISARQVRIRGNIKKVERSKSEDYFATRPRETQLSVHAWIQSSILESRDKMDEQMKSVSKKFSGKDIPCPDYWGGYSLIPFEYEFFQGRKWRTHDRLLYTLHDATWEMVRLAP